MKKIPLLHLIYSLRWNLLAWFFVNLAVVVAALIYFLRVEFGLGAHSLLDGSTGQRLDAVALPLAGDLRGAPLNRWQEELTQALGPYEAGGGVRAALVDDQGATLAGSLPRMPAQVRAALVLPRHGGADDAASALIRRQTVGAAPGKLDKYMFTSDDPRVYWSVVYLQAIAPPAAAGDPGRRVALVVASDSLRGNGLLFDYTPWLVLASVLALVSIFLWLPFIGRLTRGLTDMARTAERIADGNFAPPRISRRHDELGRLGRALGNMASRLESYVTGQKRFLGDTAHELLSPLARLEVGLSILEQRSAEDELPMIQRALGEVHHLAGIVQDLLLYTKSEMRAAPVILQPVPLAELAETVAAREATGTVAVEVNIPPDLSALADPDLLGRALANAVRNAVRYAGHAGPITVFAASSTDSPNEVILSVSDQGPGAPEAVLERLFDPFFRPEIARTRETGGTGLGLAIVKSCVEACGGRVSARNRTSAGLAVIFHLHRAKRSEALAESAAR